MTICNFLMILEINRQLTMEEKLSLKDGCVFTSLKLNIVKKMPVPTLARPGAVELFFLFLL